MRILATADLHGNLPEIPECDLFIIAGDICSMDNHAVDYQYHWLDTKFRLWLARIPAQKVVGIAGNHDFVFDRKHSDYRIFDLHLPWTYLQDSSTTFDGMRIWGLPWVPNLVNWAFYANKEALADKYNLIPKGIDIVVSHGPPRGIGDLSLMGNELAGCRAANNMMGRVKPKAFINGHIHEGAGARSFKSQDGHVTDVWNVSYVDENYQPRDRIIEIVMDKDKNKNGQEQE